MKISNKQIFKCKRSQEVFGMSFGMIFSIILIIFFFVAAFIAIRYFLENKNEIEIKTFFDDFQKEVTRVWSNAGIVGGEYNKTFLVSSKASALCFVKISSGEIYSGQDSSKCNKIKEENPVSRDNFFLYSSKKDKMLKSAGHKTIEHIYSESIPPWDSTSTNCYCIPIKNGRVVIGFLTSVENNLVKIK